MALTLAEKTYAAAFYEVPSGHTSAPSLLRDFVSNEMKEEETETEWAFAFGVAVAIARSEDPFESIHSVVDRALPAAAEAFKRYTLIDVPLGTATVA